MLKQALVAILFAALMSGVKTQTTIYLFLLQAMRLSKLTTLFVGELYLQQQTWKLSLCAEY